MWSGCGRQYVHVGDQPWKVHASERRIGHLWPDGNIGLVHAGPPPFPRAILDTSPCEALNAPAAVPGDADTVPLTVKGRCCPGRMLLELGNGLSLIRPRRVYSPRSLVAHLMGREILLPPITRGGTSASQMVQCPCAPLTSGSRGAARSPPPPQRRARRPSSR